MAGYAPIRLFAEKAAHLGDNPLVIDVDGVLSWRKAAEQVDELSRGLIELGVRKGTVVQLQLPNRREFLLLVLAIERIGAVVNPIAPIFRSNEVTVMSALARPSIVITVDNFRGFNLAEMHVTLQEQSPWVDHVIVIDTMGEAIPADALEYDRLLAVGRQSTIDDRTLALLRPDPNDVCEIIFTSGTTGQPKGVMHNQNTLNVAAELWLERVAEGCDVFHMASTLAHQTGYLYGVRAPILAGGTIVYQQVWDPVEFAGLIQEHGIHASMGATPFLADLLDVDGLATYDLSSFTAFVCAGAAIPLPVLERARDMLPCTVLPGWGMTETALSTIGRRDDAFAKLSTDGVALTGNEARVVDEHGSGARGWHRGRPAVPGFAHVHRLYPRARVNRIVFPRWLVRYWRPGHHRYRRLRIDFGAHKGHRHPRRREHSRQRGRGRTATTPQCGQRCRRRSAARTFGRGQLCSHPARWRSANSG